MIIHAPSSGTFAFFRIGQTTYISPIIIAKQHDYIIRYAQPHIIKALYLFIYGPHLRPLIGGPASHVLYDSTLVLDYFLEQIHIIFVTVDILMVCTFFSAHRCITVATHANGNQVFGIFHSFYSFTEKTIEHFLIGRIIPYSVLFPFACPLLMVTRHRFMMGSSHYNSHIMSRLAVFGIIRIKAPRPHGRPHKVSSQAENQLENAGIKTVVSIIGSIGMLYPSRKTRSFIVQKYTPVFYCRFTGSVFATPNIQVLTLNHGHIRPIIPGGHPYLF